MADILGGIFLRFSWQLKAHGEKCWKIFLSRGFLGLTMKLVHILIETFLIQYFRKSKYRTRRMGRWIFDHSSSGCSFGMMFDNKKALPLPPVARIIPYALAVWNCFKGGLDTLMKLLWNADYDPPTREVQAHDVARLLLLATTVVHWLNHISTAKPNLNCYHSLRHYRNAANKRFSFHRFLLALMHVIEGPSAVSCMLQAYRSKSNGEKDLVCVV
eukprot:scaffold167008_cov59-Attheya_sp.AAC.1